MINQQLLQLPQQQQFSLQQQSTSLMTSKKRSSNHQSPFIPASHKISPKSGRNNDSSFMNYQNNPLQMTDDSIQKINLEKSGVILPSLNQNPRKMASQLDNSVSGVSSGHVNVQLSEITKKFQRNQISAVISPKQSSIQTINRPSHYFVQHSSLSKKIDPQSYRSINNKSQLDTSTNATNSGIFSKNSFQPRSNSNVSGSLFKLSTQTPDVSHNFLPTIQEVVGTGQQPLISHQDQQLETQNTLLNPNYQPPFPVQQAPQMGLLAEHRSKKRKEARDKRKQRDTLFRMGNDPGSIQQFDIVAGDGGPEIDIQALLDQYENKHQTVVLSPKRPKKKEYKFTKDVISQIHDKLTVGQNGKVKFKNHTNRGASSQLSTIIGIQSQTHEDYQSNEDDTQSNENDIYLQSRDVKHRNQIGKTLQPKTSKMRGSSRKLQMKKKKMTSLNLTTFMTRADAYSNKSSSDGYSSDTQESQVGESALLNYAEMYKQSSRMIEKQTVIEGKKQIVNPLLKYLNSVTEKGKAPKAFGLVHRKAKNEINLKSFFLRESYVDAFSESLKLETHLQILNLSRNQLTTNRLIKIIMNLPTTLLELNLSNNPHVTMDAYRVLGEELLEVGTCKLEKLILEGCKINDEGARFLAKNLEYNISVRFLDLSRNIISDVGATEIAKMIAVNRNLGVLFMHWNKLQPRGGAELAKALQQNQSVQILDISYCSMGGARGTQEASLQAQIKTQTAAINKIKASKNGMDPEKMEKDLNDYFKKLEDDKRLAPSQSPRQQLPANLTYAEAWKQCFATNTTMLHVDFSNNGFAAPEVEVIAEGLKDNHTILGIHMIGNEATTDAQGFVTPLFNYSKLPEGKSHIFTRIQPTYSTAQIKNTQLLKLKANSNCWMCEGWSEFKFTFEPQEPEKIDKLTTPVMLHLSCESYSGELLLQNLQCYDLTYESIRMLPPGEITYYYTVDGEPCVQLSDLYVKSIKTEKGLKLLQLKVPKTNIIENVTQTSVVLTKTYLTNMSCIPRPLPKNLTGREKLKTPWDFSKSVFKDYKADTVNKLDECFEFDWESSKIPRIIKNEEELSVCKEYLRSVYKTIRETYKQYAGIEPAGNVWCIGINIFTELTQNCNNFIDGKTFKMSDLDLEFVSTNAGQQKANPRNPERQLVRFQLMEVMVRLALTKFMKSGTTKTYIDSIKMAFENHFLAYFKQFDCHKFRKERLWTEECDNTFKRFPKVLATLYDRYSGKYALPGAPKYMSLDEFNEMIGNTGILDETFGTREIYPIFNLSMMTQKNELDFDRHMNMYPVEMLEAIGRVADKLHINKLQDFFPEMPCLNKFKLDKKIESLLMLLMQRSLPKSKAEHLEKGVKKIYDEEINDPIKKKWRDLAPKF